MSLALVPRFGSRPVFVTVPHAEGPVSVCVSVHDAYHLRERASLRRGLVRASGRKAVAAYRAWQADERAWYAAFRLQPPGLTLHRRAGRRRSKQCRRGHVMHVLRDRQVCLTCQRAKASRFRASRRFQ